MRRILTFVLLALVLAACGGPSNSYRKKLNKYIQQENYVSAEQMIEAEKLDEYGKKNAVLYYLDKGLILHHAGKYEESDKFFDYAEQAMEDLYTTSISKTGGTYILNDTTVDYAGEPFERALVNVFRALNYTYMGNPEEALVEARKVEVFLEELNETIGNSSSYKDDAFARYLDSMLYEEMRMPDDARISLAKATKAYGWYASDYGVSFPQFNIEPKHDSGEIVFIHYNGVSPRKVSQTIQIAWGQAMAIAQATDTESGGEDNQQARNAIAAGFLGNAITVAFPKYVQDDFHIQSSVISTAGNFRARSLVVENISDIAQRQLDDRNTAIRARAIARATLKYISAELAVKAAKQVCATQLSGWQLQLCEISARGAAHGVAAGTEIADTRSWTTLPAEIRMARLQLPPGKHQVEAVFTDAGGNVVGKRTWKDVMVTAGRRTYLHHRTAW